MRIALHTCCGPCLLEPFDALASDGDEVVVVYANPNIHPAEEYARRRDTMLDYAERQGIRVVEIAYEPERWRREVAPHGSDRLERCRACYRLRFGLVAGWAAANGFDALASTLTVSPYQDPEAIAEEGRRAAEDRGLIYLEHDYRERYAEATRRSRELGMYRQNYCGCVLSDAEAQEERAARREARRRARDT